MLFDTDVIIWFQRGNMKAAEIVDRDEERAISAQTYMELFQGARNTRHQRLIKDFLGALQFATLPITPNISHRAMVYVEEYALSSGLTAADALVAATAIELSLPLVSGNARHFRMIQKLDLRVFRP